MLKITSKDIPFNAIGFRNLFCSIYPKIVVKADKRAKRQDFHNRPDRDFRREIILLEMLNAFLFRAGYLSVYLRQRYRMCASISEIYGFPISQSTKHPRKRIRKPRPKIEFNSFQRLKEQIAKFRVIPTNGKHILKRRIRTKVLAVDHERKRVTGKTIIVDALQYLFRPNNIPNGEPPLFKQGQLIGMGSKCLCVVPHKKTSRRKCASCLTAREAGRQR